jgi:hypothetical protein
MPDDLERDRYRQQVSVADDGGPLGGSEDMPPAALTSTTPPQRSDDLAFEDAVEKGESAQPGNEAEPGNDAEPPAADD